MAAALRPNFQVGKKELFIPKANITLLRSPLEPHFAKFRVPLSFSKLDLRDYLWHVYSVPTLSIRSYIKQQPVPQGDPKIPRPQPQRWHRPRAHKHMTVELAQPFRWPDAPKDYGKWNAEEVQATDRLQRKDAEKRAPTGDTIVDEERREAMREQARELLEGRRRWESPAGDGRQTVYRPR